MAKVQDPVCGMTIERETGAGKTTIAGETFYFCSTECLRQFEANPSAYTERTVPIAGKEKLEAHEPNVTVTGAGMTSPKFGAAASGGLEYEKLPEKHDTP